VFYWERNQPFLLEFGDNPALFLKGFLQSINRSIYLINIAFDAALFSLLMFSRGAKLRKHGLDTEHTTTGRY